MNAWPFSHIRSPYEVQLEALRLSDGHEKYGYFIEQGLGKTSVMYADFLRTILTNEEVQGMVVLSPHYLKGNWREEAEFLKIDRQVKFFMWPDKECQEIRSIGEHKNFVLLMNFEALLQSGGDFLEDVVRKHECIMTLDEPSPLRRTTGTSRQVMRIAQEYCKHRRLTYGTPDPESSQDLYLQLRFLGEIEGWNKYAFRNHFCEMGGYMGKQIKNRKNQEELAEIMARCSFRALKKDWWKDAPEKIPVTRDIVLQGAQLEHYKRMESEFWTFVEAKGDTIEIFADQAIHMLEKLQQISRGFIINDGVPHDLVPPTKNPALQLARNAALETHGKLIIFAIHRHTVNQLDEAMQSFSPAVLRGGMTSADIDREKARFNNDPKCRVIIGNEAVMARGHTLLGDADNRCSTTLFYENSFKAEMRMHAEDRNHRIGQDRAVVYIDLVASRQDKKVIKAVQTKVNLMLALAEIIKSKQEIRDGKR
jgi:hypothetical protein